MYPPNHPANPKQVVVPERQMIQREYAVYVLDHISTHFVPAQGLRNIQPRGPEHSKIALYSGRVVQPRFSDGVTNAHDTFGRISTCQFFLILDHPITLLGSAPMSKGSMAMLTSAFSIALKTRGKRPDVPDHGGARAG